MIKILNIITDTNIGGAGKLLLNYLKYFDRSQFDITVALPRGAALTPFITDLGYSVIETECGKDASFELSAIGEYKRIIKELKPDIVHTHSAFSARIASYIAKVKSRIYTRHCVFDVPKTLSTFPGKQINGLINNTLATRIVAVADAAADNLTDAGVNKEKITVIMNGVDPIAESTQNEKNELRDSLGIPRDAFVCGISARLEIYKGHDDLLAAAKEVCAKDDNIWFLIMGDGSRRSHIEATAKEYGISNRVVFTGFCESVAPYYNIMNLSVNCSFGTEASSLAIAEAMSLSLPTVATRYGGNPKLVIDGFNGILTNTHAPTEIAQAILQLKSDSDLYRNMSLAAGRFFSENLTASTMTLKLEEIYREEYARIKKGVR